MEDKNLLLAIFLVLFFTHTFICSVISLLKVNRSYFVCLLTKEGSEMTEVATRKVTFVMVSSFNLILKIYPVVISDKAFRNVF